MGNKSFRKYDNVQYYYKICIDKNIKFIIYYKRIKQISKTNFYRSFLLLPFIILHMYVYTREYRIK